KCVPIYSADHRYGSAVFSMDGGNNTKFAI
ncbi:MAG: hypothetical protein ACI84R_000985, partial [Candidatus Azotimanducaceae bacterium]